MRSVYLYLANMCRARWLQSFFFPKTAPLVTGEGFRDYPHLTENECTHCFSCMMICPAPEAIEVIQEGEKWHPVIYPGHCIRCGLCVEICPDYVLETGHVRKKTGRDNTFYQFTYHPVVDATRCMGCGNCSISCPVNKEIDPGLAHSGYTDSDEVIMRVIEGKARIINEAKCTGCKTCENGCPNGAITVARVLEAKQVLAAEQ